MMEGLYITFEWRTGKPNVGWAQMQREMADGCNPHCLTGWMAMTRKEAQALAKREGATFRDHGAATS